MGELATEAHSPEEPTVTSGVVAELRWSFTRPWTWLRGVALNLVLSLAYLVVVPLSGHHRGAWGVVVGSYFVNFILADVTVTNVFGPARARTEAHLQDGGSLLRLLLVKNLTLVLIVGVPTAILTAVLTEDEARHSLTATVPAVAFPLLCWLAFGDVVSVLLAIKPVSFRERWQQRRHWASTGRWLAHLAIPYGLFFLIEYVRQLVRSFDADLPVTLGRSAAVHALVLIGFGLTIWAAGLGIAAAVVARRGLKFR